MILIANPGSGFRKSVTQELGMRDDESLSTDTLPELEQLLTERWSEVDVVILGPDLAPADALGTVERVQAWAPEVSMILVAHTLPPELLRAALKAGVRDVLPLSYAASELRETLDRAQRLSHQLRQRAAGISEPKQAIISKVITIFSSKGGSGKSVVASNLAVLLAQKNQEQVALIDLDLMSGDLAIMLQVTPAWTLFDASEHLERFDTEHIDRLDTDVLHGYLTPHQSGVFLLPAPLEHSQAEKVTGAVVHHLIQILKKSFAFVVVDGPASFTDQILAALDESDQCVLVTSLDVPSIKNLKLALQTLQQIGFPRDRIKLVLNRADSKVGLRIDEVEKSLGTTIDISIPSSREVPFSVNQGIPLATHKRKSPVVGALSKLAEALRHSGTAPAFGRQGRARKRRGAAPASAAD